ncbi:hypothetical protein I4U23_004937 [Adineta vaga]|nr:hypothetical protein I4U23_004937 [Adineta vaga]
MSLMGAEFLFLLIGIFYFSGFKNLFCGIGMGSALGTSINMFITDRYFNTKAILGTILLGCPVFGSCNVLCFRLDHHLDYWGAILGSVINRYLLFSPNGQKLLIQMGF